MEISVEHDTICWDQEVEVQSSEANVRGVIREKVCDTRSDEAVWDGRRR